MPPYNSFISNLIPTGQINPFGTSEQRLGSSYYGEWPSQPTCPPGQTYNSFTGQCRTYIEPSEMRYGTPEPETSTVMTPGQSNEWQNIDGGFDYTPTPSTTPPPYTPPPYTPPPPGSKDITYGEEAITEPPPMFPEPEYEEDICPEGMILINGICIPIEEMGEGKVEPTYGEEDVITEPPEEFYEEEFEGDVGQAGCIRAGGRWNTATNNCEYPPADIEMTHDFDCTPGTMYTDYQGQMRYCSPTAGDKTGYGEEDWGLGYEQAWAETGVGSPLYDILEQNPEFLRSFDMQQLMGIFPSLGTEGFEFARKGYLEGEEGFRQDKTIQERATGDILRGSAREAGGQLATSGFAGGGAYGRQGGKERQKTLRDYRQAIEDIDLSMIESELGYRQSIDDLRYEYGEEVADLMALIYGSDAADLTAGMEWSYSEGTGEWEYGSECPTGQVFWGGQCISMPDFLGHLTSTGVTIIQPTEPGGNGGGGGQPRP